MRVFHGSVRRSLAGIVAAGLLLLAVPAPATAAPTPSITITDVTVTEGTGGTVNANFTIQAAPAPKSGGGAPGQLGDCPGSAATPGRLHGLLRNRLAHEGRASKVVSVPVIGDALNEATETFVVNLTNLVGAAGQDRRCTRGRHHHRQRPASRSSR